MTPYHRMTRLEWVLRNLRLCLKQAREAKAPMAARAIARAIKSADGARRHAERQWLKHCPTGFDPKTMRPGDKETRRLGD